MSLRVNPVLSGGARLDITCDGPSCGDVAPSVRPDGWMSLDVNPRSARTEDLLDFCRLECLAEWLDTKLPV